MTLSIVSFLQEFMAAKYLVKRVNGDGREEVDALLWPSVKAKCRSEV